LIDLSKKRLFLFDLDGVLLKGKERPVRIGGPKVFSRIRTTGKKLFVVTNNSTDTIETVFTRLGRCGIHISRNELLTGTRLTAEYVSERYGKATYFLVGEKGFEDELNRLGLKRTHGSEADLVLVGLDRKLTYDTLDRAVEVARNGADIVATHEARLYMYKKGPAIAVGPILRAIEYGANKRGVCVGKPSPLMFEIAMKKSDCSREETVMVGDQEDTDVEGAVRAGIDSILVRTGLYDGRKKTRASAVVGMVDDLAQFI
jgi:4-nitrophenyl phosphatase